MTQDEIHIMALKGMYITLGETQTQLQQVQNENTNLYETINQKDEDIHRLANTPHPDLLPIDQFEFIQAWLLRFQDSDRDVDEMHMAISTDYEQFLATGNDPTISHLDAVHKFLAELEK